MADARSAISSGTARSASDGSASSGDPQRVDELNGDPVVSKLESWEIGLTHGRISQLSDGRQQTILLFCDLGELMPSQTEEQLSDAETDIIKAEIIAKKRIQRIETELKSIEN